MRNFEVMVAWGLVCVLLVVCLALVAMLAGGKRRRKVPSHDPNLAPGTLAAVAEVIADSHRDVAEMLAAAKALSSKEILSAGEQLTDLYRESQMHADDLHSLSHSVLGVLNSHSEQQAKISALMADKVAEIMNIVASIERISEDAYLLGVNARIEAAHAGEAGRGFAVVAQCLQDMNKDVNRALGRIDRLSTDLTEIIPSWGTDELGKPDLHSQAERSLRQGISNAEARSAAILAKLNEALVHLQFQDRIMQQLDAAEKLSSIPLKTVRDTLTRCRRNGSAVDNLSELKRILTTSREAQDAASHVGLDAMLSRPAEDDGGDVQFF